MVEVKSLFLQEFFATRLRASFPICFHADRLAVVDYWPRLAHRV